jgi:hypothetical protein
MKLFGWSCCLVFLPALPLFGADAAPPDSLAEALPVLRSDYVDFTRLQVGPGDRLADLAARSGGEILLLPGAPAAATPPAALSALLPDNIIYCRLAGFRPASSWSDLAALFDKWIGQGADGLVLDVRSNVAPDNFDGAAQLAGLFLPAGTSLFAVLDAQQKPHAYTAVAPGFASGGAAPLPITVPMVILTDDRTAGAAEAFAAVLQAHGALVLGQATTGRGGLFAEHPLASGEILRYLAGRVVLPDGTSLWAHPVQPDIAVAADDKKEQAALALIAQEHIADVIGEAADRHRMSEAALVRGEDPEIDASLASQTTRTALPPSPLAAQDVVLVDALDSLKAIRLSQRTENPAAGEAAAPETPSAAR